MEKEYIIALDQGTTSSRAILYNQDGESLASVSREYTQYYPKEGWVEHDPNEIVSSQYGVLIDLIFQHNIDLKTVAAIGITNQRETTILWEKETGTPIYNAIVWQCRRTAEVCEWLKKEGYGDMIAKKTGLLPDAYFSATKIKWILDHVEGARERAKKGEILFGTVDTFLMWKLSGGKIFATDRTNASRTMLYHIEDLCWDDEILALLDIPKVMLPEVKPSGSYFGDIMIDGVPVPVTGVAGDQQAALFGQRCIHPGDVKNTYGTGCFMLMNTGKTPCYSKNGMVTTLAATADGSVCYAVEGSVFTGGSVVQWLRDEMHLIEASEDSEYFAKKVEDTAGVFLVPAFTGLGAPYWDMFARGTIVGITRGTNRSHIIRAALESIAYQSKELLDAIVADTGMDVKTLRVDGGACANDFLMQFQSDICGVPVLRPENRETTALGAAYLAGLTCGFFKEKDLSEGKIEKIFFPSMDEDWKESLLSGWRRAVGRAEAWDEDPTN